MAYFVKLFFGGTEFNMIFFGLGARQKINCHFSRPDLGQICLIRNCKTIPLQAGLFRGFCD
jgi:hypothetical protein